MACYDHPVQDELQKRIDALEITLAKLGAEQERVRAEICAARGRVNLSMRRQIQCPACGCTTIVHATEVLDRSDGTRYPLALAKPSIWRSRTVGHLEAYICSDCALVEWYVKDLDEVEIDGDKFRLLQGKPPAPPTPYR